MKVEFINSDPLITKIIAIGGAGANAISCMNTQYLEGVSFYAIDTDQETLAGLGDAIETLLIGERAIGRKEERSSPEMGRKAALESTVEITQLIDGAYLVFLLVESGGGTGAGAAPVITNISRSLGVFTVVVTSQSSNSGREWSENLKLNADSLISFCNDNFIVDGKKPVFAGYREVNQKMANIVKIFIDSIYLPQFIAQAPSDLVLGLKSAKISKYAMANGGKGDDKVSLAVNGAIKAMLEEGVVPEACKSIVIIIDNCLLISISEFDYINAAFEKFFPNHSYLLTAGVIRRCQVNATDKLTISIFCS